MIATVLEALKGINAYPIPLRTLQKIAARRGVDLHLEIDTDVVRGREFNLCRADLLMWLSYAPAVTQGGQSYSFTDEQRRLMRNEAQMLYDELEDEGYEVRTIYGYKGDRL